jgi:hypothetical protein
VASADVLSFEQGERRTGLRDRKLAGRTDRRCFGSFVNKP